MILVLGLLALSTAMRYDTTLRFDTEDWKYLTKFAVGEDYDGTFKVRARLRSPYRPQNIIRGVELVLMHWKEWDYMQSLSTCRDRSNVGKFHLPVEIPGDGTWSTWRV